MSKVEDTIINEIAKKSLKSLDIDAVVRKTLPSVQSSVEKAFASYIKDNLEESLYDGLDNLVNEMADKAIADVRAKLGLSKKGKK